MSASNDQEEEEESTLEQLLQARNEQAGDSDQADEEEDEMFGFAQTEAMKKQGRQQLLDAIRLVPEDSKAAYLEAMERVPHLVETESDPMRFLRFEKYNPFAAARRLVTYWKTRKNIFGERAFLPLDLSKSGALTAEDVALLNSGLHALLPNDKKNRSVWCLDRSKLAVGEDNNRGRSASVIFFLLSVLSENEMSQKDGFIFAIVLINPTGATFQRANVDMIKELIRMAFPLRLKRLHMICCPPKLVGQTFVKTFVPMTLQTLGSFFSSKAVVHVAETDEAMLRKLLPCGFRREGLPLSVGGIWAYGKFVEWQEQRGLVLETRIATDTSECDLASIVRTTLASYSAKLEESHSASNTSGVALLDASDNARKVASSSNAHSTGEASEFLVHQEQGFSKEERDAILRDIYGSTDVPFTLTKEVLEEGRARAQLEEAIDLIDDKDKAAYLEARERVPHLVELESDPLRYLRCDNMDPWAAAKHLVAYWKKRRELFGKHAFNPMVLEGKSALSAKSIELIECGYISILPNDAMGRVVILHNRSRLVDSITGYTLDDRVKCFFYLYSLVAESEESRSHGVVGLTMHCDGAPPATYSREAVQKMLAVLASGAIPFQIKALHLISPSQRQSWLQSIMSVTLKLVGRWGYLKQRTVVHAFEKDADLVADLQKFGLRNSGIPAFLGGAWHYADYSEVLKERRRYEKTLYGNPAGSDQDSRGSGRASGSTGDKKRKAQNDDDNTNAEDAVANEYEWRMKKRKMDALYARRKRERLRIEIEVLQDQCKEFGDKNALLDMDNRQLEKLITSANDEVQLHESGKLRLAHSSAAAAVSMPAFGGVVHPSLNRVAANPQLNQLEELLLSKPNLREKLLAQLMQNLGGVAARNTTWGLTGDSAPAALASFPPAPDHVGQLAPFQAPLRREHAPVEPNTSAVLPAIDNTDLTNQLLHLSRQLGTTPITAPSGAHFSRTRMHSTAPAFVSAALQSTANGSHGSTLQTQQFLLSQLSAMGLAAPEPLAEPTASNLMDLFMQLNGGANQDDPTRFQR